MQVSNSRGLANEEKQCLEEDSIHDRLEKHSNGMKVSGTVLCIRVSHAIPPRMG